MCHLLYLLRYPSFCPDCKYNTGNFFPAGPALPPRVRSPVSLSCLDRSLVARGLTHGIRRSTSARRRRERASAGLFFPPMVSRACQRSNEDGWLAAATALPYEYVQIQCMQQCCTFHTYAYVIYRRKELIIPAAQNYSYTYREACAHAILRFLRKLAVCARGVVHVTLISILYRFVAYEVTHEYNFLCALVTPRTSYCAPLSTK